MVEETYSAGLISQSFWFVEMKKVIKLIDDGKSEEEIKAFLEENGYTYPVLMDTTGEVFMSYGVNAFPTTFMITREGEVFGYASGQLNEETMKSIVEQTMSGKRE